MQENTVHLNLLKTFFYYNSIHGIKYVEHGSYIEKIKKEPSS